MIKEFKRNSVDIATILEVNKDIYLNIYNKVKIEKEIEIFPIEIEDTIFNDESNNETKIILTI